jgi:hypothetical protein
MEDRRLDSGVSPPRLNLAFRACAAIFASLKVILPFDRDFHFDFGFGRRG